MAVIEIRGLRKNFGDLSVLRGVDFSVEEGERVVIIGGSGCGKSVFLRCIELLEIPDAGQIFIDGEEITAPDVDIDKIRRRVGMVYQRFNLFAHMNVMDNLCLAPVELLKIPRAEAEKKALELLSQVGLVAKASAFPAVLSGGQQQRIAICRSLMMNPKVILFDEPTSALDPTMVGEVLAVIRMLAKKDLTMIIVTHEMNFAREVATKILFFADGGIYEQGTPAEIFDNPQREKTIAFIQRQKYFHYEITARDFDLMEMQNKIWLFAEKYGLSAKHAFRVQLCCEEIIYEMLDGACDTGAEISLVIDIAYAEAVKKTQFKIICRGREHNPFAENDDKGFEDSLGVTILRNVAQDLSHSYRGGVNEITFKL